MSILELKIPPAILLALAILGVYFSPRLLPFIPIQNAMPEFRAVLAWLVFSLGVAIAVVGVITFKMAKTTTNPMLIENTSTLVTHGIYRFTRNPMYLGMLLVILFFIIKTGYLAGVIFAVVFVAYMNMFQIKPEERMLTKIFGKDYTDYTNRTRPWL